MNDKLNRAEDGKSDAAAAAASAQRPETGVMRFPGDWPGIFIRGDDALEMAISLEHIADNRHNSTFNRTRLLCLARLLGSCAERRNLNVQRARIAAAPASTEPEQLAPPIEKEKV